MSGPSLQCTPRSYHHSHSGPSTPAASAPAASPALKSCLRAGKYVRSASFNAFSGDNHGNRHDINNSGSSGNNYNNYSSSAGHAPMAPPSSWSSGYRPESRGGPSVPPSPSLASTAPSSHYSSAPSSSSQPLSSEASHPSDDIVHSPPFVPMRATSFSREEHSRQASYQSREEESTIRASHAMRPMHRSGTADHDYGAHPDNNHHNHGQYLINQDHYPMQTHHHEATGTSPNFNTNDTAPAAPPSAQSTSSNDDAERQFMKLSQTLVTAHQSSNDSSTYSSSSRELLHRILPNYSSRRNYWLSLRRNMSYLPMFPEPHEHASFGLIRYVDRVFGPLLNRECADDFGDFGGSGGGGLRRGNYGGSGSGNGSGRGWGGNDVRDTEVGAGVSSSGQWTRPGSYNHSTTHDASNNANNASSLRMPLSHQTSLDSYHNKNDASYRKTFPNDRGTIYADDHLPPFQCPGGPMFPPPSQFPNQRHPHLQYDNTINSHLPPPIPIVEDNRANSSSAGNRRGLSVEIPPPSPYVHTPRAFHSDPVATTPAAEPAQNSDATSANTDTPVITTTAATPVATTTNATTLSGTQPDEIATSSNNHAYTTTTSSSNNHTNDVPTTPRKFEALPTPLHSNTSKTITSQQTSSTTDVPTSTTSIPDIPSKSMEQPQHYTFASIHSPPPTPLPFFKSLRHVPNKSLVGNSTDDSSFCNVSHDGIEKNSALKNTCAESEDDEGNETEHEDGDDTDNEDDKSLATAFFEYQTFSTKGMLPPIPSRESVLFYPPPKESKRSSCCGSSEGRGTPRQPRKKRPPTYLQMYIKCERSEPFHQPDSEMDIVTWYQNEKHQVTVDRTLVVRGTTTLFDFIRAVVQSFGLLSDCDPGGQSGGDGTSSLGCYKDICFLSDVKTTTSWETNGTHLTPLPIPGFYYKYVDRDVGKTPSKKKKKKKKEGSSVLSNDPEGLRRTLLAQVLDRPIYPGSNNPDRDSPLGMRIEQGHRTRLALVYCTPKREAYVSSRTLRGVMPETIYHFQILLEGIVEENDLPSSFQSQTAVRCVGASGGVQGGCIIDSDEEIDILNRQFWGQREVIGLVSSTANPKSDLEQILGLLAIPLFDYTGQQTMREFVIDRCIYHIASGNLSMEVAKRTKDTVEAMQGTTAWLAKQMEQWASGLTQSANECCDEDENALCTTGSDEFDIAVSKVRGGKKSSKLLFL